MYILELHVNRISYKLRLQSKDFKVIMTMCYIYFKQTFTMELLVHHTFNYIVMQSQNADTALWFV